MTTKMGISNEMGTGQRPIIYHLPGRGLVQRQRNVPEGAVH